MSRIYNVNIWTLSSTYFVDAQCSQHARVHSMFFSDIAHTCMRGEKSFILARSLVCFRSNLPLWPGRSY